MFKVLLTYFAILVSWTVYRYYYRFSEPMDEIMAKPLVFVLPVVWYIWHYEKGEWGKIWGNFGDRGNKGNLFQSLYLGIGLGMILGAEAFLFNFLKYGRFNFQPVLPVGDYGLAGFLGLSAATAVSEEILGRGFLYQQLRYYLSDMRAVFLSSLLFLLLHLPLVFFILPLSGVALAVYLVSVFVLSIANCILFRFSGSLLTPILLHIFWNATVGLYL